LLGERRGAVTLPETLNLFLLKNPMIDDSRRRRPSIRLPIVQELRVMAMVKREGELCLSAEMVFWVVILFRASLGVVR